MISGNKIVRVKETFNNQDELYYKISLMTYSDYLRSANWKEYGRSIELYPFKWYDLRWIIKERLYKQQIDQSGDSSSNKTATIPPKKQHIIRTILIGLFIAIASALILHFVFHIG